MNLRHPVAGLQGRVLESAGLGALQLVMHRPDNLVIACDVLRLGPVGDEYLCHLQTFLP